jgi:hypothetical protein
MPLPEKTFLFQKRLRRAGTTIGKRLYPSYACHIYAYDLASRTQRLIDKLDDDGVGTTRGCGRLALSPDRRWVAFGSGFSKRIPDDNPPNGFKAGVLEAMSVDGKQTKRLTPRLPDDFGVAAGCTGNRDCPASKQCIDFKCSYVKLRVSYSEPLWSRDGKTIYFQEYLGSDCNPYWALEATQYNFFINCSRSSIQPVSDGKYLKWIVPSYVCSNALTLAIHPRGDVMLVRKSSCTGPVAGTFDWSLSPEGEAKELRKLPSEAPFIVSAAWMPDGSALLMAAGNKTRTKSNPEGDKRDFHLGIYRWTDSTGYQPVYVPESEEEDVLAIALSKSGEAVVEIARIAGERETSQLHLFDLQTGKLGDQLTPGEESGAPAW